MLRPIVLIMFLLPLAAFSQVSITGNITDIITKKPVESASVILSNTTRGTVSAADGSFNLQGVKPGQYDLVVSVVGYELYHHTINVTTENIALQGIGITPQIIDLKEVVIKSKRKKDPDRVNNLEMFKTEFLGPGANSCKIINPDVINLYYDSPNKILAANSSDFIVIDNKAIGYRIKYRLDHFIKDANNMAFAFSGSVLFEDLPGTESQQKSWQKARNKAYYGSLQHFLKSSLKGTSSEEGFNTMKLTTISNPKRPVEDLIKAKLSYYRNQNSLSAIDSLAKWQAFEEMSAGITTVSKKPLNTFKLIKPAAQKGLYTISAQDTLYIIYTKRYEKSSYATINGLTYHPFDAPDNPISIVKITADYAVFDNNGTLINPKSVILEGDFSKNRVSGMLPFDFEPAAIK